MMMKFIFWPSGRSIPSSSMASRPIVTVDVTPNCSRATTGRPGARYRSMNDFSVSHPGEIAPSAPSTIAQYRQPFWAVSRSSSDFSIVIFPTVVPSGMLYSALAHERCRSLRSWSGGAWYGSRFRHTGQRPGSSMSDELPRVHIRRRRGRCHQRPKLGKRARAAALRDPGGSRHWLTYQRTRCWLRPLVLGGLLLLLLLLRWPCRSGCCALVTVVLSRCRCRC